MMRQKDFPKEIEIGKSAWTIKFVKNINHFVGKGKVCVGLCDYENSTIYIRQGLEPRYRLEVFCHELLHALDDEFDLNLTHKMIYKLDKAISLLLIQNFLPQFRFDPNNLEFKMTHGQTKTA